MGSVCQDTSNVMMVTWNKGDVGCEELNQLLCSCRCSCGLSLDKSTGITAQGGGEATIPGRV